jgi:phosphate-selective porin OprO/OprP
MRIGLMGNIPYDFGYYVLVETSQFLNPNETGPFLLDAFVSYNRFQYAKVAVGSFKIPFGRELSMPCHGLYTIQRSFTVDELTANLEGGNRDIGVDAFGGSDTTLFTYRAAITNGTGHVSID